MSIKVNLRQFSSKSKGKSAYNYLAIVLPKIIMDLKPTHVKLTGLMASTITIPIKKRKDKKGYGMIPRNLVDLFHLTKNQEIEVILVLKDELK